MAKSFFKTIMNPRAIVESTTISIVLGEVYREVESAGHDASIPIRPRGEATSAHDDE
jgi:hypothetical protein